MPLRVGHTPAARFGRSFAVTVVDLRVTLARSAPLHSPPPEGRIPRNRICRLTIEVLHVPNGPTLQRDSTALCVPSIPTRCGRAAHRSEPRLFQTAATAAQ